MKKRLLQLLSLISFLSGLYLIDPQITGAMIGTLPHTLQSTTGIFLILISGILFIVREKESVLEKKVKHKELPKNIGEAIDRGVLRQYLSGKRLIPETNLPNRTYSKHTKFTGKKMSKEDFAAKVGKEAQYLPTHTLREIREFERKVALKARGYSKGPHVAEVYGISHQKRYGPTGASKHKFVGGIKVELQERPDGIYVHGYPIPIEDIPTDIKRKIKAKKKKS